MGTIHDNYEGKLPVMVLVRDKDNNLEFIPASSLELRKLEQEKMWQIIFSKNIGRI